MLFRSAAVDRLTELVEAIGRGDVKAELMSELERQRRQLQPLEGSEAIDQGQLSRLLGQLGRLLDTLHTQAGPPAQRLHDDPLLSAVMKRSRIPGGTCGFDLPAFQCWLAQPADHRRQTLEAWLHPLEGLRDAVGMLLRLLRETGRMADRSAESGAFQEPLDPTRSVQLIRVAVDPETMVYPEISASRHRVTIRFLELPQERSRPVQTENDVAFGLCYCYG